MRQKAPERALEPAHIAGDGGGEPGRESRIENEPQRPGLVVHELEAEPWLGWRDAGDRPVPEPLAHPRRELGYVIGRPVRGERQRPPVRRPRDQAVDQLLLHLLLARERVDVVEQESVERPQLAPEGAFPVLPHRGDEAFDQSRRGQTGHGEAAGFEHVGDRVKQMRLADAGRSVKEDRRRRVLPGERLRRAEGTCVALPDHERLESVIGERRRGADR